MNVAPLPLEDLIVSEAQSVRDVMLTIDRSGLEVALLCDDQQRLRAVITDGDIRRALLRGVGLDDPIAGVGNRDFQAVGPHTHRSEAVQLMTDHGIKCVPVVDDDGILTDLHTLHVSLLSQRSASWAVVMAGGLGTRLGELTTAIPKPMLPIGDRPILQHIVEHLVSHGIRRVFLSVNYLSEMIESHFGDGSRFHCQIDYLRENEPLGTGGALRLLPERPLAPLVVMNGDLLTRINISRLLAFHRAGEFAATMAVRQHTVKVPFGVAEIDDARVRALVEKPTLDYQINAGIYALDPALLPRIPTGTLFPITHLLEDALQRGEKVGAYHMQESWNDIGLPEEFQSAQAKK